MNEPQCGHLCCIMGPMFAGKSTELLRRASLRPGPVYSPSADVRARVTHDGAPIDCKIVDDAVDILRDLHVLASHGAIVGPIYVDEAQFFRADLMSVVEDILRCGHDVTLAGLTQTWQGAPFGVYSQLILRADEVVVLHARCSECGRPAMFTDRVGEPGANGCGGAEAYAPRCRRHWRGGCF